MGKKSQDEIDTSDRERLEFWGRDNAVFLDEHPFRPYGPPWTAEELRAEILKKYISNNE